MILENYYYYFSGVIPEIVCDDIIKTAQQHQERLGVTGNLTEEDVKPLYKKNYWDVIKADNLPSGVDISTADMCVNAGPSRAAKILQKATGGLTVDGAIGKMTIAAVHDRDPKEVLDNYYYGRQKFYEGLDDFQHYGKGWTRRNKETLELALSIV